MITGAMRTTATDVLDAHTNLLPFHLLVNKHCQRAALQLATLPESHLLHKPVKNVAACNVKKHPTPLHELMHTYKIKPQLTKTIRSVRQDTKWAPNLATRTAGTAEQAEKEDGDDQADIQVYSDGSGIEGRIGAAAVLYRDGVLQGELRFHLGSDKHHMVYEGEGIGMVLGLELIRLERHVNGPTSMGVDNQAAISATGLIQLAPSHYIWDLFHQRLQMVTGRHKDMDLTVQWTPGHVGIQGNERVDEEAKRAAQEGSSAPHMLPAPLRRTLPRSKSALKQAYQKKLKLAAQRVWHMSPRYTWIKSMYPTLPSTKFKKLVALLPRKHASLLIQLRTGHIPLNKHLHHISKAESPICPCCQRFNETIHHFLILCPAHQNAWRTMIQAAGRDATSLTRLLSDPELLSHLFCFIGRSGRLRSVFGDVTPVIA
jgi:hypothetical protein